MGLKAVQIQLAILLSKKIPAFDRYFYFLKESIISCHQIHRLAELHLKFQCVSNFQ